MGNAGWIPSITVCWLYALPMLTAFNVETEAWKRLKMLSTSFGYQVTQEDISSLLVSAPLEQYEPDKRGRVYQCQLNQARPCSPLNINVPSSAVNMSLGLTMTRSDFGMKTVVCGPTITKECDKITLYGGMCFSLPSRGAPEGPVPPTLEDCQAIDIAFLLDGSGSVRTSEFWEMKVFVTQMIKKLLKKNTQFAISQYSSYCQIHLNFNDFRSTGNWEMKVQSIGQQSGGTNTAGAISMLVNELFVPHAGARPNAKKILIVITDGESQDRHYLPNAIAQADAKKIIRYAIGVGKAFSSPSAREELNKIATSAAEHVFKVDSFSALEKISSTLESNIIAIEGTQTTGDATKMEFAQSGFSAVYVSRPAANYFLGTVGAYGWSGGFQQFPPGFRNPRFVKADPALPDSYLGYSMDVANRDSKNYIILGAPRYEHKGLVVVINGENTKIRHNLRQSPEQIGSYFGAEVRAVDLDGGGGSDLILVSAPMHTDEDREGKVFVYQFKKEYFYSVPYDTGVVLVGLEDQRGRFGSSLASLRDLNGDGLGEVAVGAPLEDEGRGSVYIFNGRRGGINPTYSQRIAGSSVDPGLRFFGVTVAPSALDQSGDKLPDIAVGSQGEVLLLRSRPVVSIEARVNFDPAKIPTTISDCSQPLQMKANICFNVRKTTPDSLDLLGSYVKYNLTLDARRKLFRASFSNNQRSQTRKVTLKEMCTEMLFFVECSPEDILNPLSNSLSFEFEAVPIPRTNNLRPVMTPSSRTSTVHTLDFEIDCGKDKVCVDNLKVDFSFSGTTEIEVGIAQELNVTVTVENRGENSYNTHVYLSYPPALSYRTFTKSKGRVECKSKDSEDDLTPGRTTCDVNRPVFKAGSKAVFVIQFGIDTNSQLGQRVNFTATADSGNGQHSPDSITSITREINVKYSIYVIIKGFEDTTNYINFTADAKDLAKPVQHNLQVVNAWRDLRLTVFVKVPIRLKEQDIWTDLESLKIFGCRNYTDVKPVGDVIKKLQKDLILDCSVATCRVFTCIVFLSQNGHRFLNISGNVTSGWIEKTGLREAQFGLVTEATMEYDQNKYIYYSDSRKQPSVSKIRTDVEVYDVPNFTKEIIGGSVGGLILLALITAGLYKAGFFKSHYKQMMEEAGQETAGGEAQSAPAE